MTTTARTGPLGWAFVAVLAAFVAVQCVTSAHRFIGDVASHGAAIAESANLDADAYRWYELANRYAPHDFRTKLGLGQTRKSFDPETTGSFMFDEALKLAPYHVPSLLASAEALTIRGNFHRARVQMDRANALTPENWRLYDVRARWYSAQGMHDEAMEQMRLALRPELFPAIELNARAAWVFLAADRLDEAERYAARVLQREPSTPLAHFALGEVARRRGDTATAAQEYWEAMTIEQFRVANGAKHSVDWVALNRSLAETALPNLQLVRASRGLAEAAAGTPADPRLRELAREIGDLLSFPEGQKNGSAHLHLGRAWAALGDAERARAALLHAQPLLTTPEEQALAATALAAVPDLSGAGDQ